MNNAETWFESTLKKLSADGFEISRNVADGNHSFKAIAFGLRKDLLVRGNSIAFFIFEEFNTLDIDTLRKFSSDAFTATDAIRLTLIKSDKKLKTISSVCFAVAIVQNVDESAVDSICHKTPPLHWAAFEVPVIFDQGQQQLHYLEKTPWWGFAYYRDFRAQIKKYLSQSVAKTV